MPRRRRALAVAALAAVAAAIPVVVVGSASPAYAAGTVVPSKSAAVDPAGETLTVSGSGFDSARGIYAQFCKQVGTSGTAEGRPSGANCAAEQFWITGPGAGVPPSGVTAWTGAGTFEVSFPVAASFKDVDCRATGVVCGFVTRNDHREPGVYDQDSFTPITFAADVVEPSGPQVSVAPASDLDAAGDTVTVTGSGFPDDTGVYVRFCARPAGTVGTAAGRPSAATCDGEGLWVTPNPPSGAPLPTIVDGAFAVDLDVVGAFAGEMSVLDCMTDGACGVAVRRDHVGGSTDYSLDSFTGVAFGPETTPPDVEEPVEPTLNDVVVELSKSSDLTDGETVTVTGSEFTAEQGVYVQFCAAPIGQVGTASGRATQCYPEQDGTHTVWVTPIASSGEFTTPLTLVSTFVEPSGTTIDCTVDGACGVFVRRDHNGGSSDYSQDAFVPVSFGDGVAPPAVVPTLSLDRTSGLDPVGDTVTVEGSGYQPGQDLFVALCDPSVANFAACDFAGVVEVAAGIGGSSGRALGDPGTFSAELQVQATYSDTDCTDTGTDCVVSTWAISGGDGSEEQSVAISFATGSAAAAPSGSGGTIDDGTLARTGAPIGGLAALGFIALALGVSLVRGSRRRHLA